MKLDQYIKQHKTSQKAIAAELKARGLRVNQSLVSQWIRGDTRITLRAAVELEKVTGGKVTVYEWLSDKAA